MSYWLWSSDAVHLLSEQRVLAADDVPRLSEARAVLEAVQALHAQQARRLEAAHLAAHAQGLDEGRAEGERLGRAEWAERLLALQAQADRQRETDRAQVAALALEVARRLLGELPDGAALAQRATQAARELLPARIWRLHVAPAQAAALRAALASCDGDDRTGLAQAQVVPDPLLGPHDCRLETECGHADASLNVQLARLAQAWGADAPAGASHV